jgi:uncharacterized membrane protein
MRQHEIFFEVTEDPKIRKVFKEVIVEKILSNLKSLQEKNKKSKNRYMWISLGQVIMFALGVLATILHLTTIEIR